MRTLALASIVIIVCCGGAGPVVASDGRPTHGPRRACHTLEDPNAARRPIRAAEAAVCQETTSCPPAPQVDTSDGTPIAWFDDRSSAQRAALRQDKLLLVLHLSGNFAKEEFT